MQKTLTEQAGFLLLEIIFALALATGLMLIIFPMLFYNQQNYLNTKNRQGGLSLAKQNQQITKTLGFAANILPDATTTIFFQHQQVTWLSDYAKQLNSTVSFSLNGTSKAVETTSLLINQQNLLGRDTCDLYFSGSWENPQIRGSASLSPNNPATSVDVNNDLAFVSANSSTQSLEDLSVFDVSNPDQPILKSKLNTGPGINAIRIAGNFLFAANDGTSDQLEIINISNPNSLGPVIKIRVPNFNGQQSDGRGMSIFYYQNKIFLGLTKNNGPELHVYDVSNPQFPVWVGSYETNTAVNGIYVFNNIAYLALADGKLLDVLDVSNPSTIFETGSFSPSGSTSQSAQSIVGLGDNIFLGRAGGLPALGYKELYWLNKNNINQPAADFDLNASINAIFVRNGLLFLATGQANQEFQVFSFKNNQLNKIGGLDLSADAIGIDCEGQNIFLSQSDGKIQIVSPGN